MKADGVKKNLILQFMYQFVILVVPLIVSPYLARTLGETAIGEYTYINSIAYYFVLICMLGIQKYGQREIASKRDDEVSLRKSFWSLFTVHVLFSFAGLIGYVAFCCIFADNHPLIYYSQALYVFSAMFDITWLFYGIERFKVVVIRNIVVKITELTFVFTLVKSSDDLFVYAMILSVSALLGNLSLMPTAFKYIKPIKFEVEDALTHLKPMLVLAVSVFAISLYTVFDKTLLGLLSSKESVAYYEYSNKIINIPKVFITVIGTVLFPRACNFVSNGDFDSSRRYYRYSLSAIYFIGCASVFGLLAVADLFAVIYYGPDFAVCGSIIKLMTPLILIIGIGDIFRMQFLIPLQKDKQYIVCIFFNAVINVILSTCLIPVMGVYGAVIGTTCAELFGMLYQFFLIKKYVGLKDTILTGIPFMTSGIIMLVSIWSIRTFMNEIISHLLTQILLGAIVYTGVLLVWFLFFSKKRFWIRDTIVGFLRAKNN